MSNRNRQENQDSDADMLREATKAAIREFLDEKFAAFGRWSLGSFAALALAGLIYFILKMNGWHK